MEINNADGSTNSMMMIIMMMMIMMLELMMMLLMMLMMMLLITLNLTAFEILISSPRLGGFTTFLKQVRTDAQFTLPSFSLSEIRTFGKMMNYHECRIKDACLLYDIFSGVPRYCYELAYDTTQWNHFIKLFKKRRLDPILSLNNDPSPTLEELREFDTSHQFPHRLF